MGDSISQLIIVLGIFAGVLFVTYLVTRWIAGYQKTVRAGSNVKLIESVPLTTGKYIQIVRIADKYVALAIWKDGVAKICDVDEQALNFADKKNQSTDSFKSVLSGAFMSGQNPGLSEEKEPLETETQDHD